MGHELNQLLPTRYSLLSRLKDYEDQESWRDFFETYWRLIYSTAIKAGLNDAEAQDVVQETILSVLRKIPEFEYDPQIGSFKCWLLQLTTWRIIDQRRLRLPVSPVPNPDGTSATVSGTSRRSGACTARCASSTYSCFSVR